MNVVKIKLRECCLNKKIENKLVISYKIFPESIYNHILDIIVEARRNRLNYNKIAAGLVKKMEIAQKKIDFRLMKATYKTLAVEANQIAQIFQQLKRENNNATGCELIDIFYKNSELSKKYPLIDIPVNNKLLSSVDKSKFWYKKLTVRIDKNFESLCLFFNLIGKNKDWIVSHDFREKSNLKYKIEEKYFNSDAKKKIIRRRAEMLCILNGITEFSDALDYQCAFITINAPRIYHINGNNGPIYWDPALTPDVTNKELCRCWKSFITRLTEDNVNRYTFRVVEPHKDGTPHWHVLIWYDKKDDDLVNRRIKQSFGKFIGDSPLNFNWSYVSDNGNNPVNQKIHYCLKTLNAAFPYKSHNVEDCRDYRSVWGIRGTQFSGLPPLALRIWRMCKLKKMKGDIDSPTIAKIIEAVGNNRFSDFLSLITQFKGSTSLICSGKKNIGFSINDAKVNIAP